MRARVLTGNQRKHLTCAWSDKFLYDGIDFPFEDQSFDLVVTRYALHHFPDIELFITERVNNLLFRKNGPMEGVSDEG